MGGGRQTLSNPPYMQQERRMLLFLLRSEREEREAEPRQAGRVSGGLIFREESELHDLVQMSVPPPGALHQIKKELSVCACLLS